jgi:integrase
MRVALVNAPLRSAVCDHGVGHQMPLGLLMVGGALRGRTAVTLIDAARDHLPAPETVRAGITLKKEVATLRACWNWVDHAELVKGAFPGRGLRFPKEEEKEPLRTFAEIEAIIAAEKPDAARKEALWQALYLTKPELDQFLAHVKKNGALRWVYPMVAFAAFTGAPRSEILRALASDVDLAGGIITIREKKRVVGKRSTRTAPITPKLAEVLREWLRVRPEASSLFCQAERVSRSKTQRNGPTAVTKDEAHDHFKRTVAGSKWATLRGYHVLRHSFISVLASEGVDQRVIDEIVGHQSEEQRKRYRHLYRKVMRDAISRVFG